MAKMIIIPLSAELLRRLIWTQNTPTPDPFLKQWATDFLAQWTTAGELQRKPEGWLKLTQTMVGGQARYFREFGVPLEHKMRDIKRLIEDEDNAVFLEGMLGKGWQQKLNETIALCFDDVRWETFFHKHKEKESGITEWEAFFNGLKAEVGLVTADNRTFLAAIKLLLIKREIRKKLANISEVALRGQIENSIILSLIPRESTELPVIADDISLQVTQLLQSLFQSDGVLLFGNLHVRADIFASEVSETKVKLRFKAFSDKRNIEFSGGVDEDRFIGSYGIEIIVEFDTHSISEANPPKVTVKIELPESVTIPEPVIQSKSIASLVPSSVKPIVEVFLGGMARMDMQALSVDFTFAIDGTEELDRLTTCFTDLEGSSSAAFNGDLKYYKADDDGLRLELAKSDFVDKGRSSGYLAFFGISINRKMKKDELRFLRDIFQSNDDSISTFLKDIFPEKSYEVAWEDFLSSEITLESLLSKIAGKMDDKNIDDPYRKVLCAFKFALVKKELKEQGFSDEVANFIIISSIQNSGQQNISSLLSSSCSQIVSNILLSIFGPIGLFPALLGTDTAMSSVRRDKNGCMTFSVLAPGQVTKLNSSKCSFRLMLNAKVDLKEEELGFYVDGNNVVAKLQGKDDFSIPAGDPIHELIMVANKRAGTKGFTAKEKELLSQNPLLRSYNQKISDFYVQMNITFPSSPSLVPEITFSVTLPETVSGRAVKKIVEEKLVTALDTRFLHEEVSEILISRLRLRKNAELGIEDRQADAVTGSKKSALLRLISGYIGILQVVPESEQKLADMQKLQGVLEDKEETIPQYFKHAFSKILGTENKANADAVFSLSFAANHDASDHRKKYSSADVMDAVQGAVLYDLSGEGRTDNTLELLCDGHLMKKLVEDSSGKNIEKLAGILLDYYAQANTAKQKFEQELEKKRDETNIAKLEHAKEALKNAECTLERFLSTQRRPFGINFGKRMKLDKNLQRYIRDTLYVSGPTDFNKLPKGIRNGLEGLGILSPSEVALAVLKNAADEDKKAIEQARGDKAEKAFKLLCDYKLMRKLVDGLSKEEVQKNIVELVKIFVDLCAAVKDKEGKGQKQEEDNAIICKALKRLFSTFPRLYGVNFGDIIKGDVELQHAVSKAIGKNWGCLRSSSSDETISWQLNSLGVYDVQKDIYKHILWVSIVDSDKARSRKIIEARSMGELLYNGHMVHRLYEKFEEEGDNNKKEEYIKEVIKSFTWFHKHFQGHRIFLMLINEGVVNSTSAAITRMSAKYLASDIVVAKRGNKYFVYGKNKELVELRGCDESGISELFKQQSDQGELVLPVKEPFILRGVNVTEDIYKFVELAGGYTHFEYDGSPQEKYNTKMLLDFFVQLVQYFGSTIRGNKQLMEAVRQGMSGDCSYSNGYAPNFNEGVLDRLQSLIGRNCTLTFADQTKQEIEFFNIGEVVYFRIAGKQWLLVDKLADKDNKGLRDLLLNKLKTEGSVEIKDTELDSISKFMSSKGYVVLQKPPESVKELSTAPSDERAGSVAALSSPPVSIEPSLQVTVSSTAEVAAIPTAAKVNELKQVAVLSAPDATGEQESLPNRAKGRASISTHEQFLHLIKGVSAGSAAPVGQLQNKKQGADKDQRGQSDVGGLSPDPNELQIQIPWVHGY